MPTDPNDKKNQTVHGQPKPSFLPWSFCVVGLGPVTIICDISPCTNSDHT